MYKMVKIGGERYSLQLSVSRVENEGSTDVLLGSEATEQLFQDKHLLILSDDELDMIEQALRFWNEEHEKRLREKLLALGVEGDR